MVSLPSACNASTSVALSDDCNVLAVKHKEESESLVLPAPVKYGSIPKIAPSNNRELAFRLPVRHAPDVGLPPSAANTTEKAAWSASMMTSKTQVGCLSCQALLINHSVTTFKDLPSENWAEMMDFWHCHKPETEDEPTHQTDGHRKGYGAANSIAPSPGIALVDTLYILLKQEDCNITFDEEQPELLVSSFPTEYPPIHP